MDVIARIYRSINLVMFIIIPSRVSNVEELVRRGRPINIWYKVLPERSSIIFLLSNTQRHDVRGVNLY